MQGKRCLCRDCIPSCAIPAWLNARRSAACLWLSAVSACALAKPSTSARSCAALYHALLPTDSSAALQLGTHLRAKRKREEMSVLLRKTKK